MGGFLGITIGISIVSAAEVVQLIVQLVAIICTKPQVTPPPPEGPVTFRSRKGSDISIVDADEEVRNIGTSEVTLHYYHFGQT